MVTFLLLGLLAAAQQPAQPDTSEHARDPRDKMICKRFLETGSLVRGYRVCKTKGDWERERANIRAVSGASDSCGNRGNGGPC